MKDLKNTLKTFDEWTVQQGYHLIKGSKSIGRCQETGEPLFNGMQVAYYGTPLSERGDDLDCEFENEMFEFYGADEFH